MDLKTEAAKSSAKFTITLALRLGREEGGAL